MAAGAHIKQQELTFDHLKSRDEQELHSLVRRAHLVATLVEAEPEGDVETLKTAVGAISEALEKAMKIMENGRSDVAAVHAEIRPHGDRFTEQRFG